MQEYRLEGVKMTCLDEALDHIGKRLDFETYDIVTLDDLWNELVRVRRPVAITLYDSRAMLSQLGQKGYDMLDVFNSASRANRRVFFDAV